LISKSNFKFCSSSFENISILSIPEIHMDQWTDRCNTSNRECVL